MTNITLHKIDSVPLNEEVLLYWNEINHFENGTMYEDYGEPYHVLFDGESMYMEPSHWTPLPSFTVE